MFVDVEFVVHMSWRVLLGRAERVAFRPARIRSDFAHRSPAASILNLAISQSRMEWI